MGFLEDVGEETLNLVGVLVRASERTLSLLRRLDPYPLLEGRGIEYKDYLILKAEAASLLFFLLTIPLIFGLMAPRKYLPPAGLLALYVAYLVHSPIRRAFREDYPAYRDFFASYLGASLILLLSARWNPFLLSLPYLHLVLVSLALVLLFLLYFRLRYSRDYTFGRVLEAGNMVRVKTNFDIRSGVKPGVHTFENRVGARVGDRVRLAVERGSFNLRGGRVVGVMEVVG